MKYRFSLLPRRVRPLDAALVALSPLLWLALLEAFARGSLTAVAKWAVASPLTLGMSYALLLGLSLALTLLATDRARLAATALLALFFAVFGLANYYKLLYRLEPVLWTDLWQLGDLGQTVAADKFDIDMGRFLLLGGLGAAAVALCLLLARGRQATRPVLPAAIGLALTVVVARLCTFSLAGGAAYTDMCAHAQGEGCLYAAVAMENYRGELMRLDYSEQDVRRKYIQLEEIASDAAVATADRPNLVVILSEAFVDEQWLGQYLSLNEPLMPFYQQLLTQCERGRLYVPKVGGGTSETEFEVLTGLRSRYALNPYSMGLPPMNSLASVLRARGYDATAIHWLSIVYYNRYRNLKMEGFDALYSTDTTTTDFERKGAYVSDGEHFNAVVDQIERSESRDFVYCITMQNHGGYSYDDFRARYGADVPFGDRFSADTEMQLANYCWLLRQTDEALRELIERLERLDEPTVVAFFGDHIPAFGAQAYEELGVPTTGDASHWTPYFIWSSEGLEAAERDMRAWQLGARALALCGAGDDPFLHYVEMLRQTDATDGATYDLLCYDALFGKQYAYDQGGLRPANEDFQIGGRMELSGFDAAVLGDTAYLRPRLAVKDQAYTLEVNGEKRYGGDVPLDGEPLSVCCVMLSDTGAEYNRSNALTFDSAGELLKSCGTLKYEATPLHDGRFEVFRDLWYQRDVVFKSGARYSVGRDTALTAGGGAWTRRSIYDVSKAGEYGIAEDGTLYIAVARGELSGYGVTADGVRKWLEDMQATVFDFAE